MSNFGLKCEQYKSASKHLLKSKCTQYQLILLFPVCMASYGILSCFIHQIISSVCSCIRTCGPQ